MRLRKTQPATASYTACIRRREQKALREMATSRRIESLDALRGLAALSVCWFHFTNGNPEFLASGWLRASGIYGWMGVDVFFVISGFVIPYSLHNSGYKLGHYFTFVLKRIVRLDPPYLAAIAITIVLGYLSAMSPSFRGQTPHLSIPQVLLHFAYLNVFFGYQWLNPVFWTLAIEFQYYLAVGFVFPLLSSSRLEIRMLSFIALGILAFLVPSISFIFHYLFLFMLGIATFQYWTRLVGLKGYLAMLLALGAGAALTLGFGVGALGLGTACVIAFVRLKKFALLKFLGAISYSLYLLHVPVGGRVVGLSLRFVHTMGGKVLTVLLALGVAIVAAYLLYWFVERPAQRWSSSISYPNERSPINTHLDPLSETTRDSRSAGSEVVVS